VEKAKEIHAPPVDASNPCEKHDQVDNEPNPKSTYSWYVVSLLLVFYIYSFIDRQIRILFFGAVKKNIEMFDFLFYLLFGFALTVLHTVFGLLFARTARFALAAGADCLRGCFLEPRDHGRR